MSDMSKSAIASYVQDRLAKIMERKLGDSRATSQDGAEQLLMSLADRVRDDPAMWITAFELRQMGFQIPPEIPDAARALRAALRPSITDSSMTADGTFSCTMQLGSPAFEWIELHCVIEPEPKPHTISCKVVEGYLANGARFAMMGDRLWFNFDDGGEPTMLGNW